MKKTLSINISGILFHIEEDGYDTLKNYLESITSLTFALLVLTFIWPIAAIVFGSVNFLMRIGMVLSYSISP